MLSSEAYDERPHSFPFHPAVGIEPQSALTFRLSFRVCPLSHQRPRPHTTPFMSCGQPAFSSSSCTTISTLSPMPATPPRPRTSARSAWKVSPMWRIGLNAAVTTQKASPTFAATVFRGIQCSNPRGGSRDCEAKAPTVFRISPPRHLGNRGFSHHQGKGKTCDRDNTPCLRMSHRRMMLPVY